MNRMAVGGTGLRCIAVIMSYAAGSRTLEYKLATFPATSLATALGSRAAIIIFITFF